MNKDFKDLATNSSQIILENITSLPDRISSCVQQLEERKIVIEKEIEAQLEELKKTEKDIRQEHTKEVKKLKYNLDKEDKDINNEITDEKKDFQEYETKITNEKNEVDISNQEAIAKYLEISEENLKILENDLSEIYAEREKAEKIQENNFNAKKNDIEAKKEKIEEEFNKKRDQVIKSLNEKLESYEKELETVEGLYTSDTRKIKEIYAKKLSPIKKEIEHAKAANQAMALRDYTRQQSEIEIDYKNEIRDVEKVYKDAKKAINKQILQLKKDAMLKITSFVKEKLKNTYTLDNELEENLLSKDLLINYAGTYEVSETAKKEREIREVQIRKEYDEKVLLIKSEFIKQSKDSLIEQRKLRLNRDINIKKLNYKVKEVIYNSESEVLECISILSFEKAYADALKSIYKLYKDYKIIHIDYYEEINQIFNESIDKSISNINDIFKQHNIMMIENGKHWNLSIQAENEKLFKRMETHLKHSLVELEKLIKEKSSDDIKLIENRYNIHVKTGNIIDQSKTEITDSYNQNAIAIEKYKDDVTSIYEGIIEQLDDNVLKATKNHEKTLQSIQTAKDKQIKAIEAEIKLANSTYQSLLGKEEKRLKALELENNRKIKELNAIITKEKRHADKTLQAIVSYQHEMNSKREYATKQTKERNKESLTRKINKEHKRIDLDVKKQIKALEN